METARPAVLIVPVDVAAFCVGQVDAHSTSALAGAQVDFRNQTTDKRRAFIGENVTHDLSEDARIPLEKGVHLHWALPDALTHSQADGGTLAFPPVPNRWLVSRITIAGATASIASWVVESDALLADHPPGQTSITLPVKPRSPTDQNFRYVGRHSPAKSYVVEAAATATATFTAHAGRPLCAVSNGTPSFASFYPNCRSVFGFWDEGVPATAELMYVVTGWHEDPRHDPATLATARKPLHKTHRWVASSDVAPAATLYSGLVQSVAWDAGQAYISRASQAPIAADVAIGANPAEAMAACFAAATGGAGSTFEQLLNALQFGLLKAFVQPQGDQRAKLDDALHEKEFAIIDAGLIYTITAAGSSDAQDDAIDLPLALADALNELNILRQQYDRNQATLAEYRWQLFADWYRLFEPASDDSRNAAYQRASGRYAQWEALNQASLQIAADHKSKLATVNAMLTGTGLALKALPAPRYWQPAEPAVLVRSPDLAYPSRYGGDGAHTSDGTLVCRTAAQLLSAVKVGGTTVEASTFAPTLNAALPHVDVLAALVSEACLLNTALVGAKTGQNPAALQPALGALLAGGKQSVYQATGTPPSPLAVRWWNGNPWLPMFLSWQVDILPVQETVQAGTLRSYPASFFAASYRVDPGLPSLVCYQPSGNPINPGSGNFDIVVNGASLLSPAPARHFAKQLTDHVATHSDQQLSKIIAFLGGDTTLVQPLSGFTRALIMRQQTVQLPVATTPDSLYAQLTDLVRPIIGNANAVAPLLEGYFDPIRAGYMKVRKLQAVDVFGQRRDITFSGVTCASSMVATVDKKTYPSVAYLAPRVSQPARLLWNWIAAGSAALDEMNAHPASSPVCGWLMPQHLALGFFLYDQQGKPLGNLTLNGDKTSIQWQSAPGDDATINRPIEDVLADAHPQLLALGKALRHGTIQFFTNFWKAVDTVHGSINPALLSENSGLAVLVGRPVALVQALLRLELRGPPALNQGWAAVSEDDTDNGLTAVQFPVILGDIDRMDDGLIGYFLQAEDKSRYAFGTFFTAGASGPGANGVVQPTQGTITLTAAPKLGATVPPKLDGCTAKVLMLVDPRARVHATTGILPTQTLQIPPDQSSGALSTLEMSFPAGPVLRGASGLAIPIPKKVGFAVAFVEETKIGGTAAWTVDPAISVPTQGRSGPTHRNSSTKAGCGSIPSSSSSACSTGRDARLCKPARPTRCP